MKTEASSSFLQYSGADEQTAYNEGHAHEVLHLASTLADFWERHIVDTRCSDEFPDVKVAAIQIGDAIGDFYQLVGSKFSDDNDLIAAAPDMLAALKAVDRQTFCDCIQSDGSQIESERTQHEPECWVPLLRAAIAKATGTTPKY
jgi:hypothetical protein